VPAGAQPRAVRRAGAGDRVGRPVRGVLLAVPHRLLADDRRLRRVRVDGGRAPVPRADGAVLTHPFMQHAFLAGTAVALAAGLVGYFLVLRAQVFTADALSHVAFTGALAALAAGLDPRVGLFALTVLV